MDTIVRTNPSQAHAFVLEQVIAQMVMDWDSLKEEFDRQFQETK